MAEIDDWSQRHGVEVRPADVMASDWDCTLEPIFHKNTRPLGNICIESLLSKNKGENDLKQPVSNSANVAVRLGLRLMAGLGAQSVHRMRPRLAARRLLTALQLRDLPHGSLVRACGMVTMRQQPQTAKGTVFVTLEDETGTVNVIV